MVQSMQLRAGSSSLFGDDQEDEIDEEKEEDDDDGADDEEKEKKKKKGHNAFPDAESWAQQEWDRESSTCEQW